MAFTDRSDLFAAMHENGINATIRQLMLQRPSMFNYATSIFTQALSSQFCVPINVPSGGLAPGQSLFTVEPQLPVLGAPKPLGLDWCLQLTNVSVDLYPGNTLTLPPELGPIGSQQFALHLRACFGLACPNDRVVENLAAEMEAAVASSILAAKPVTLPTTSTLPRGEGSVQPAPAARAGQARDVQPVPSANVICSCLEVFGVGHFQQGTVSNLPQQWLTVRLDNLDRRPGDGPADQPGGHARVLPAGGASPRRAAAAHRAHGESGTGHHPDAPGQRHPHRPARHAGPGGRARRCAEQPGRRGRPAQSLLQPQGHGGLTMADLTIAVSEAVCAKTLEVIVANFGFDVADGADFGAFRAGYDGRLVLKGGSLELRDDGTVRLRELDARWDKLDFSLGITLPEISFGGGVVDLPLGTILLPGASVFSGNPTVTSHRPPSAVR
jgi:hypothetical protein